MRRTTVCGTSRRLRGTRRGRYLRVIREIHRHRRGRRGRRGGGGAVARTLCYGGRRGDRFRRDIRRRPGRDSIHLSIQFGFDRGNFGSKLVGFRRSARPSISRRRPRRRRKLVHLRLVSSRCSELFPLLPFLLVASPPVLGTSSIR